MDKVSSSDGTTIAFDRLGAGPPVILVSGASTARAVHEPLAAVLATDFTVFNYDRRGRGDSGDTPPYEIQREVEDLHAVLGAAGGAAAVFGNSSGAVLALHAAAAGLPITKLALWEPPFMVDPDAAGRQRAYATQLAELLDAGRRGDAMVLFMRSIGVPEPMIAGMRNASMWPGMEAWPPHWPMTPPSWATARCPPTWSPRSRRPRWCWTVAIPGPGRPAPPRRSPPRCPTRAAVPSTARATMWPGTSSPPNCGNSSPGEQCRHDEAVAGPRVGRWTGVG
jgi:hypothetical protein